MRSLTNLVTYYTTLSQNNSAANIANGKTMINDAHRYLFQKYYDNEKQLVIQTVTGQQAYTLPFNNFQIKDITVRVGGLLYTPPEVLSRQDWDIENFIQYQSSYPLSYFIYNNQLLIFPIPSADNEPITFNYKTRMPDLVLDDVIAGTVSVNANTVNTTSNLFGGTSGYTTSTNIATTGGSGTGCTVDITALSGVITAIVLNNKGNGYSVGDILTITGGSGDAVFTVASVLGSQTVIGSGTGWQITTGINELRWLNIPFPSGDNEWYQVAKVNSATELTLVSPYTGLETVSGANYTLGQIPIIKEDFQDLLVYRPLAIYFESINKDEGKRAFYQSLWQEGISRMDEFEGSKTTDVGLGDATPVYNPNLYPYSLG